MNSMTFGTCVSVLVVITILPRFGHCYTHILGAIMKASDLADHTLTPSSKLRYARILINKDNVYDPATGIFTVPHDGKYMIYYDVKGSCPYGFRITLSLQKSFYTPWTLTVELKNKVYPQFMVKNLRKDERLWMGVVKFDHECNFEYSKFVISELRRGESIVSAH